MNILVTGGAGFIGSHLIERLLDQGHQVVCVDNFDDYYDPQIKRKNIAHAMTFPLFRLYEADIRNAEEITKLLSSHRVDIVVHLAARAGVRPSILDPEIYYDVNVIGTLRLLEAMRIVGTKKMIFGSSSSVYGNNPKVPFAETDIVDDPISPYAASKKAAELLCHTYHHLYDFDVFCLRFFTVYGPRQRPDMAIHRFIEQIKSNQPIVLYGDGTSKRDYTFVADIVHGIEQTISRVQGYEILNLGESRTTSLVELVENIEEELGVKAEIRWKPMQSGDVNTTYADIQKAKRLLGYNPKHSIREGIRLTCHWKKNPKIV